MSGITRVGRNLRRLLRNTVGVDAAAAWREVTGKQTVPKRNGSRSTAAPADSRRLREERSKGEHKAVFQEWACERKPFLNVGPGKWRHPYWQTLDILQDQYSGASRPDVVHDLSSKTGIPMPSASLKVIYCSHVVEHLDDEANAIWLAEAFRILEPGGVVRVVFPDVDVARAAYMRGDRSLFLENWPRKGNLERQKLDISVLFLEFFAYHRRKGKPVPAGYECYENADVEALFRRTADTGEWLSLYDQLCAGVLPEMQARSPGAHRNWWNVEKLVSALKRAGFSKPLRSAYLQSELLPLRNGDYFDQTHPQFSGYVEARR